MVKQHYCPKKEYRSVDTQKQKKHFNFSFSKEYYSEPFTFLEKIRYLVKQIPYVRQCYKSLEQRLIIIVNVAKADLLWAWFSKVKS